VIQKYVPFPSFPFFLSENDTTICSMTWSGQQGFQTPIANDSFLVDGIGALGRTHTERGLTYYEVALCGHMCVYKPITYDDMFYLHI
jgi:hypothetical protein